MLRPERLDLSKNKMYSAKDRHNLVTVDNLMPIREGEDLSKDYHEMEDLIAAIVKARKNNKPVTMFFGAHVIKCGLSNYLIEMINRKFITHLASNGAGSIHDFELAYLGGTSEYVPRAIEDGSFGMWEETGRWMNEAINIGYKKGYGYGQSLAEYIHNNPDRFPYRDKCVLYNAYLKGIPATYHISIGTDIIHQHPIADFAALGYTSGEDFKIFCNSLVGLDGGVHMNFGSAVQGPEVFLKALSIVRNQKLNADRIVTANFDLIPLGDYKSDVGSDHYHYYYRPRKNVINRPTSLGGRGFHFAVDHTKSIPYIYNRLKEELGGE